MKYNLTKILANAFVCTAVIVGLTLTHNPNCLWGLLFTLIISQTDID